MKPKVYVASENYLKDSISDWIEWGDDVGPWFDVVPAHDYRKLQMRVSDLVGKGMEIEEQADKLAEAIWNIGADPILVKEALSEYRKFKGDE